MDGEMKTEDKLKWEEEKENDEEGTEIMDR